MELSEVTEGTSRGCFRRRSGIWTSLHHDLNGGEDTATSWWGNLYGQVLKQARSVEYLASQSRDIWTRVGQMASGLEERRGKSKEHSGKEWSIRRQLPNKNLA